MASPRKRIPWSHWDRLLMIVLGLVLALVVGIGLWLHTLEEDPVVSVPTSPMPSPNAYDLLTTSDRAVLDARNVRWAAERDSPGLLFPANAVRLTTAQKDALLRENAGVLLSVRRGLRCPYRKPPARSLSERESGGAHFGEIANLLELDAQVNNGHKKWGAACEAELELMQLGETVPRGGGLEDLNAGLEWQKMARRQAYRTAPHLTASQAGDATRRLEAIRAGTVPFVETVQEEKRVGQACLLEVMHERDWRKRFVEEFGDGSNDDPSLPQKMGLTPLRLTSKRTIMANYQRYLDQSIANAGLPFAAHPQTPQIVGDVFADALTPIYGEAYFDKTNNDTQDFLLLATLALRAYKLDHGSYPATLSALVPRYLKSAPTDPFALSSPLRYKITGSRYVLYSVGPDGKDDGGNPIETNRLPCDHAIGTDGSLVIYEFDKGDIRAGLSQNGNAKSGKPCNANGFGGPGGPGG